MQYLKKITLPMGDITMASDGENLTGLWFECQKYYGSTMKDDATARPQLPVFAAAADWLDRYFAGVEPQISELPLAPEGSEFRQLVWQILCAVPYGQVTTYGQIADEVARRQKKDRKHVSAQAVGGAVAHNPISIIIPCHRAVGSGGSLTGYAGGLDRKIVLLELEGVDTAQYSVPAKK